MGFCSIHAYSVVSVVPVVVVAGPDPLPAPRRRLPSPTRAAIETNADGEWHRREGEAAMTKPIETSKAWGKSWPEREAAGPDEPATQTAAAEASAHHRTTEASAHPAAKASTHAAAEASAYHCAAKASASHPAVKATKPTSAAHSSAALRGSHVRKERGQHQRCGTNKQKFFHGRLLDAQPFKVMRSLPPLNIT